MYSHEHEYEVQYEVHLRSGYTELLHCIMYSYEYEYWTVVKLKFGT